MRLNSYLYLYNTEYRSHTEKKKNIDYTNGHGMKVTYVLQNILSLKNNNKNNSFQRYHDQCYINSVTSQKL
jgi:hypothetical protein